MNVLDFSTMQTKNMPVKHVIKSLHDRKPFGDECSYLLNKAIDNGGYIAGGFAATVYRALFVSTKPWLDVLVEYMDRGADIDVFFLDKKSVENVRCLTEKHVIETNNCYSIKSNISIQLVKKFFGPPEDMFKTFDISNACCALTDHGLVWPVGYRELIDSHRLHVRMWNDNTVRRVQKWFVKQQPHYTTLHRDNNARYLVERGSLYKHVMYEGSDTEDTYMTMGLESKEP